MWGRWQVVGPFLNAAVGLVATGYAWHSISRTSRALPCLERRPAPLPAACPPRIAVVLAARDEAEGIARCVWSLAMQSLAPVAMWVVDDHSTDATAQIVMDLAHDLPALALLPAPARPAGWAGKNWALHCGMRAALAEDSIDWFLLTDADTWHAPALLARAWDLLAETGTDVLSVFPGVVESDVGAQLLRAGIGELYSYLYGADYPLRTADPRDPAALAAGQFILARTSVVRALGGFDQPGLRGALDDDHAWVLAAKAAGFRVAVARSPRLLVTRGYPTFRAAWQGHAHHLAASLRGPGRRARALVALVALPAVALAPFVALARLIRRWRRRGMRAVALPLATWGVQQAATSAVRWRAAQLADLPWWYVLAAPLGALLAPALALSLLWRRGRGHAAVTWKGRRYAG